MQTESAGALLKSQALQNNRLNKKQITYAVINIIIFVIAIVAKVLSSKWFAGLGQQQDGVGAIGVGLGGLLLFLAYWGTGLIGLGLSTVGYVASKNDPGFKRFTLSMTILFLLLLASFGLF